MGQFDHRHLIQPQLACSSQTTVARDDAVVAINQNRVRPAIFDDAGGDLGDLRIGMCARIAGVGISASTLRYSTLSVFKDGVLKKKTRRRNRGRVLGLVRTGGVRTANRANLGSHPDAKKRRARAPALAFGREGPVDFWSASSAVTSVQTIMNTTQDQVVLLQGKNR